MTNHLRLDVFTPDEALALFAAVLGPARLDRERAAAVLAVDGATAEALLEILVDTALLESPEPGVYRYHRLVRALATQHTP
ncbi:hypothetical protein P9869_06915 [Streptomyces ossamyceticus]|nr:hypothetical protein [Streptomyces ossamyceticus]